MLAANYSLSQMTKHTGSWTRGKRKRCEATAYVFLSYIKIKSYQQNYDIENYFNADLIFRHYFLTLPGNNATLQEGSISLTQGFILIMSQMDVTITIVEHYKRE